MPSGTVRRVYGPPDGSRDHLFNDLVVDEAGDVYLTDSEASSVYVKRAGRRDLQPLFRGSSRSLAYPNGIALMPGGGRLLVAHANGMIGIDTRSGRTTPVTTTAGASLAGIDGLYLTGSTLVAIQGTDTEDQVLTASVLGSSRDGVRLGCVTVIERQHPAYELPTTGVVVGDSLFYVANSQVRRLDRFDRVQPRADGGPTIVLGLAIPRSGCAESPAVGRLRPPDGRSP